MSDIIEIEITRVPQDGMPQHAEVQAMARLTPLEGGYYVYVKSGVGDTFAESRGFLAARAQEDIWALAVRTLTWAATEAEKRS